MGDVNPYGVAAAKKRFATINTEELDDLLIAKDAENTSKATTSAVRTIRCYLLEKGLSPDFENYEVNELDKILSKLYAYL